MIEIAIAAYDHPGKKVKEGDIVAVRPPSRGVGLKEMHDFIWLRVEGYDWHTDAGWLTERGNGKKRKHRIPLTALLARAAGLGVAFDATRVRNPADAYQPFLPVDANGVFQTPVVTSFPKAGLIFDKDGDRFI